MEGGVASRNWATVASASRTLSGASVEPSGSLDEIAWGGIGMKPWGGCGGLEVERVERAPVVAPVAEVVG
jgi:hypothetical protein